MKRILYIVLFLSYSIGYGQGLSAFNQGNNFYNEGKFQEAINAYESVLENGQHSAELYFNLANSYYKTNQIAPSIYYYEKALQLAPNDKEIANNLSFAQNMTIDAIDVIPEVGLSKILKNIVNVFSVDVWAILSVCFVILFVVSFLTYYFAYHTNRKRFMFVTSIVSIGLAIITLLCSFHKYNIKQFDNPAIVFAQKTDVKSEPNLRSENAFSLHEGTKVQVLEHYDEHWSKIKLADGKTGWIPLEDIKLLNNF